MDKTNKNRHKCLRCHHKPMSNSLEPYHNRDKPLSITALHIAGAVDQQMTSISTMTSPSSAGTRPHRTHSAVMSTPRGGGRFPTREQDGP